MDLADGIKESLREHSFDLSLLESKMIVGVLDIELHVANTIHIAAMKYCESKTETPQQ